MKFFRMLFTLLFFVSALSWVISRTERGQSNLKAFAERSLSTMTGAKVTVGSVDLLFPLFIKLHDLDVSKEDAFVRVDSLSCVPLWLDLPFKRLTLLNLQGKGIEVGGEHPETLLASPESPSLSLSIFYFRLRSVHIVHKKIPGKAFDGSLKGRLYFSSDTITARATLTRSIPTAWPKRIQLRFAKKKILLPMLWLSLS